MSEETNLEASRLVRLLRTLNSSQRISMLMKLIGDNSDLAVEVLLGALHITENDNEIGLEASYRLRQLKDKVPVLTLVQMLKEDRDFLVRANAANTLGASKSAIVVEPLINALGDENEVVRVSSAISLSKIGDKQALEPLLMLLHKSSISDYEVLNLVGPIAELDDGRVFEPLNNILLHYQHDSEIYLYTIEMLGLLTDERAFHKLLDLSSSSNKDERLAAIRGLGWTNDARALATLKSLAFQDDYINKEGVSLKQSVAEGIERIEQHLR